VSEPNEDVFAILLLLLVSFLFSPLFGNLLICLNFLCWWRGRDFSIK
jgi:hypothetical protein